MVVVGSGPQQRFMVLRISLVVRDGPQLFGLIAVANEAIDIVGQRTLPSKNACPAILLPCPKATKARVAFDGPTASLSERL
jgi:hypothetical protein